MLWRPVVREKQGTPQSDYGSGDCDFLVYPNFTCGAAMFASK